eukprot:gnl/Chilomastix_cuspidata/7623.p1 GENE.gnl/Chilomastix_cuspidata/7623~~gnl/Chilomastix_cuspidata/7623.p1  ORF type:complete len:3774 (-),score=284.37 gnl/Chilomastix_cuspidata/7623:91-9981(-)
MEQKPDKVTRRRANQSTMINMAQKHFMVSVDSGSFGSPHDNYGNARAFSFDAQFRAPSSEHSHGTSKSLHEDIRHHRTPSQRSPLVSSRRASVLVSSSADNSMLHQTLLDFFAMPAFFNIIFSPAANIELIEKSRTLASFLFPYYEYHVDVFFTMLKSCLGISDTDLPLNPKIFQQQMMVFASIIPRALPPIIAFFMDLTIEIGSFLETTRHRDNDNFLKFVFLLFKQIPLLRLSLDEKNFLQPDYLLIDLTNLQTNAFLKVYRNISPSLVADFLQKLFSNKKLTAHASSTQELKFATSKRSHKFQRYLKNVLDKKSADIAVLPISEMINCFLRFFNRFVPWSFSHRKSVSGFSNIFSDISNFFRIAVNEQLKISFVTSQQIFRIWEQLFENTFLQFAKFDALFNDKGISEEIELLDSAPFYFIKMFSSFMLPFVKSVSSLIELKSIMKEVKKQCEKKSVLSFLLSSLKNFAFRSRAHQCLKLGTSANVQNSLTPCSHALLVPEKFEENTIGVEGVSVYDSVCHRLDLFFELHSSLDLKISDEDIDNFLQLTLNFGALSSIISKVLWGKMSLLPFVLGPNLFPIRFYSQLTARISMGEFQEAKRRGPLKLLHQQISEFVKPDLEINNPLTFPHETEHFVPLSVCLFSKYLFKLYRAGFFFKARWKKNAIKNEPRQRKSKDISSKASPLSTLKRSSSNSNLGLKSISPQTFTEMSQQTAENYSDYEHSNPFSLTANGKRRARLSISLGEEVKTFALYKFKQISKLAVRFTVQLLLNSLFIGSKPMPQIIPSRIIVSSENIRYSFHGFLVSIMRQGIRSFYYLKDIIPKNITDPMKEFQFIVAESMSAFSKFEKELHTTQTGHNIRFPVDNILCTESKINNCLLLLKAISSQALLSGKFLTFMDIPISCGLVSIFCVFQNYSDRPFKGARTILMAKGSEAKGAKYYYDPRLSTIICTGENDNILENLIHEESTGIEVLSTSLSDGIDSFEDHKKNKMKIRFLIDKSQSVVLLTELLSKACQSSRNDLVLEIVDGPVLFPRQYKNVSIGQILTQCKHVCTCNTKSDITSCSLCIPVMKVRVHLITEVAPSFSPPIPLDNSSYKKALYPPKNVETYSKLLFKSNGIQSTFKALFDFAATNEKYEKEIFSLLLSFPVEEAIFADIFKLNDVKQLEFILCYCAGIPNKFQSTTDQKKNLKFFITSLRPSRVLFAYVTLLLFQVFTIIKASLTTEIFHKHLQTSEFKSINTQMFTTFLDDFQQMKLSVPYKSEFMKLLFSPQISTVIFILVLNIVDILLKNSSGVESYCTKNVTAAAIVFFCENICELTRNVSQFLKGDSVPEKQHFLIPQSMLNISSDMTTRQVLQKIIVQVSSPKFSRFWKHAKLPHNPYVYLTTESQIQRNNSPHLLYTALCHILLSAQYTIQHISSEGCSFQFIEQVSRNGSIPVKIVLPLFLENDYEETPDALRLKGITIQMTLNVIISILTNLQEKTLEELSNSRNPTNLSNLKAWARILSIQIQQSDKIHLESLQFDPFLLVLDNFLKHATLSIPTPAFDQEFINPSKKFEEDYFQKKIINDYILWMGDNWKVFKELFSIVSFLFSTRPEFHDHRSFKVLVRTLIEFVRSSRGKVIWDTDVFHLLNLFFIHGKISGMELFGLLNPLAIDQNLIGDGLFQLFLHNFYKTAEKPQQTDDIASSVLQQSLLQVFGYHYPLRTVLRSHQIRENEIVNQNKSITRFQALLPFICLLGRSQQLLKNIDWYENMSGVEVSPQMASLLKAIISESLNINMYNDLSLLDKWIQTVYNEQRDEEEFNENSENSEEDLIMVQNSEFMQQIRPPELYSLVLSLVAPISSTFEMDCEYSTVVRYSPTSIFKTKGNTLCLTLTDKISPDLNEFLSPHHCNLQKVDGHRSEWFKVIRKFTKPPIIIHISFEEDDEIRTSLNIGEKARDIEWRPLTMDRSQTFGYGLNAFSNPEIDFENINETISIEVDCQQLEYKLAGGIWCAKENQRNFVTVVFQTDSVEFYDKYVSICINRSEARAFLNNLVKRLTLVSLLYIKDDVSDLPPRNPEEMYLTPFKRLHFSQLQVHNTLVANHFGNIMSNDSVLKIIERYIPYSSTQIDEKILQPFVSFLLNYQLLHLPISQNVLVRFTPNISIVSKSEHEAKENKFLFLKETIEYLQDISKNFTGQKWWILLLKSKLQPFVDPKTFPKTFSFVFRHLMHSGLLPPYKCPDMILELTHQDETEQFPTTSIAHQLSSGRINSLSSILAIMIGTRSCYAMNYAQLLGTLIKTFISEDIPAHTNFLLQLGNNFKLLVYTCESLFEDFEIFVWAFLINFVGSEIQEFPHISNIFIKTKWIGFVIYRLKNILLNKKKKTHLPVFSLLLRFLLHLLNASKQESVSPISPGELDELQQENLWMSIISQNIGSILCGQVSEMVSFLSIPAEKPFRQIQIHIECAILQMMSKSFKPSSFKKPKECDSSVWTYLGKEAKQTPTEYTSNFSCLVLSKLLKHHRVTRQDFIRGVKEHILEKMHSTVPYLRPFEYRTDAITSEDISSQGANLLPLLAIVEDEFREHIHRNPEIISILVMSHSSNIRKAAIITLLVAFPLGDVHMDKNVIRNPYKTFKTMILNQTMHGNVEKLKNLFSSLMQIICCNGLFFISEYTAKMQNSHLNPQNPFLFADLFHSERLMLFSMNETEVLSLLSRLQTYVLPALSKFSLEYDPHVLEALKLICCALETKKVAKIPSNKRRYNLHFLERLLYSTLAVPTVLTAESDDTKKYSVKILSLKARIFLQVLTEFRESEEDLGPLWVRLSHSVHFVNLVQTLMISSDSELHKLSNPLTDVVRDIVGHIGLTQFAIEKTVEDRENAVTSCCSLASRPINILFRPPTDSVAHALFSNSLTNFLKMFSILELSNIQRVLIIFFIEGIKEAFVGSVTNLLETKDFEELNQIFSVLNKIFTALGITLKHAYASVDGHAIQPDEYRKIEHILTHDIFSQLAPLLFDSINFVSIFDKSPPSTAQQIFSQLAVNFLTLICYRSPLYGFENFSRLVMKLPVCNFFTNIVEKFDNNTVIGVQALDVRQTLSPEIQFTGRCLLGTLQHFMFGSVSDDLFSTKPELVVSVLIRLLPYCLHFILVNPRNFKVLYNMIIHLFMKPHTANIREHCFQNPPFVLSFVTFAALALNSKISKDKLKSLICIPVEPLRTSEKGLYILISAHIQLQLEGLVEESSLDDLKRVIFNVEYLNKLRRTATTIRPTDSNVLINILLNDVGQNCLAMASRTPQFENNLQLLTNVVSEVCPKPSV